MVTAKVKSKRLDLLLVERGLAESQEKAQGLILAGRVLVKGLVAEKPGHRVTVDAYIVLEAPFPYVSRGGLKLEDALRRFRVDMRGKVAADVGASTGGFSDCLLQHGAARVYAIDVGYGQLAWSLRQDPRVIVLERTNIRYLESLPEPVELAAIDVSFISLELVLPAVKGLLKPTGEVIALVKPQFEAGRREVRGGVVKDPTVHRRVLKKVARLAKDPKFRILGIAPSPLLGPAGNVEFFVHLSLDPQASEIDVESAIIQAVEEAQRLKTAKRDLVIESTR